MAGDENERPDQRELSDRTMKRQQVIMSNWAFTNGLCSSGGHRHTYTLKVLIILMMNILENPPFNINYE